MNKTISIILTVLCVSSLSYSINVDQELMNATLDKNISLMQDTIRRGANVNFKMNDFRGNPTIAVLHQATLIPFYEGMRLLIANNADVNIQGNIGYTPLILSARSNDIEAADILIKAGADVNLKSSDGRSPLVYAILGNPKRPDNIQLVNFLIESRADVNSRDQEDNTPLHYAVQKGNVDIVNLLLENGANIKIYNKKHQTPYTLAVEKNNKEIQKLIANQAQESQKRYVENISTQSRRR